MSNRKLVRRDYTVWAFILTMVFIILWGSNPLLIYEIDFRPLFLIIVGMWDLSVIIFEGMNWRIQKKLLESIFSPPEDKTLEMISSRKPTYVLIDSIDRELLDCLDDVCGNLVKLNEIVLEENILPSRLELGNRLRKLTVLGLIKKNEFKEMYLTSRGRDALNAPAPLFASNISAHLWSKVQDYKIALWQSNWSESIRCASLLLEEVLKDQVRPITILDETKWNEIREANYQGKNLDDFTLGQLVGASRQLRVLKEGTLESWLASELNKVRKNTSHLKDNQPISITATVAANVDLLLDIFLQLVYSTT